jgi:hypothetical protein
MHLVEQRLLSVVTNGRLPLWIPTANGVVTAQDHCVMGWVSLASHCEFFDEVFYLADKFECVHL